jgi:hypothetical protein
LKIYQTKHRGGLSAVNIAVLVDHFDVGKVFCLIELELRTGGWVRLPLRALVVAHTDMEVIIDCLIDCLAQFEYLSQDASVSLHPLTWYLFGRGGQLREMILLFVMRDRTFEQLPALKRIRDISHFVPCLEISVERKHAQIHSQIRAAPNHSVAYVSLRGLRLAEFEDILQGSQESAESLMDAFGSQCRSALQCARSLGLDTHEALLEHANEDTGSLDHTLPHHAVVDVVYRCDAITQFRDFEDFPDPPEGPPPLGGPQGVWFHESSASAEDDNGSNGGLGPSCDGIAPCIIGSAGSAGSHSENLEAGCGSLEPSAFGIAPPTPPLRSDGFDADELLLLAPPSLGVPFSSVPVAASESAGLDEGIEDIVATKPKAIESEVHP